MKQKLRRQEVRKDDHVVAVTSAGMTPGEEVRHQLFLENQERLEQLAYRAMKRELTAEDVLVVCIDVDDSEWTEMVDALMPGYDWQSIRDQGMKPVARGSARREGVGEYLMIVAPDVKPALSGPPPTGHYYAAVMGAGGVSIYAVVPQPEKN